ncbi:MAG: NAD(P)H-binding protein [Acidimicrobiia bacterium]|nr:NAD(P)H-binding protein [Acidimicrobiia bacterium]
MDIFVTGATGVLGRRVVPLLMRSGHHVTALARTDAKAADLTDQGAEPVVGSLFDTDAMATAVAGHDAVLNLATSIPTGRAAATKRGWATNDRIRREGSAVVASAARSAGIDRLVQESITFPYADAGADWITEDGAIEHHWGTEAVAEAEANALRAAEGVVLRFAMFVSAESGHVQSFVGGARRGLFALPGSPSTYFSMIDADDAAAAVVAALGLAPGVYNVVEDEPATRADLATAMAAAAGRNKLRRIPDVAARMGGAPARAMMRSMRVSNQRLRSSSDWAPATPSVAGAWERYQDVTPPTGAANPRRSR